MKADIVCVGSAYLTGMMPEKNGIYLASRMAELDVNIRRIVIVAEQDEEIRTVLDDAYRYVDSVLVAGGIGYGRRSDVYAEFFNQKTIFSDIAYEHLKAQAEKAGVRMEEQQMKSMAVFPEGALILNNYAGYVPGYILEKDEKKLIVLPSGEKDLQSVFEDDVVGYIFKQTTIGKSALKIILNDKADQEGISKIIERLGELIENDNPGLDIIRENGVFVIRIKAFGPTNGDAMILANLFASDCCSKLGREMIRDIVEDVI